MLCVLVHSEAFQDPDEMDVWCHECHYRLHPSLGYGMSLILSDLDGTDKQLGLWTTKIGFHNTWEFWFYNVLFGLGQAPYYAYAQALMSDLCPPGYEGMFCQSNFTLSR
jgi:hypothetical protein